MTPGKKKGLEAVSNAQGVIAAAAMDQRGSLKTAIAKEKGVDKKDVTARMLEEFKTAVTRILTPYASAILLDPEYGLPAAAARAKNAGLLLAYENSGYDNTRPGRLPDLLDIWSVRRLVSAGADCIKILLYYTPFDPPDVNEIKHAWVERIGGECAAADVPFFLEFVGYQEAGDEKSIAFARNKPDIVTHSMAEFSKPQYGVDVLKVEVPVNMAFVAGSKSCKGEVDAISANLLCSQTDRKGGFWQHVLVRPRPPLPLLPASRWHVSAVYRRNGGETDSSERGDVGRNRQGRSERGVCFGRLDE